MQKLSLFRNFTPPSVLKLYTQRSFIARPLPDLISQPGNEATLNMNVPLSGVCKFVQPCAGTINESQIKMQAQIFTATGTITSEQPYY